MTLAEAPSHWDLAADIFDPPEWEPVDRPELQPHQKPPSGMWSTWLLEAGRGAGKTEACSRFFTSFMRKHPGTRGRIIAPTYDDAVESCVNGPSGLVSVDPEVRFTVRPGGSKVMWPNGSEALVLGTPYPRDVDRLRAGGNRGIDWWEEMAANAQLWNMTTEKSAWDQAQLGLRMGDHPISIASSTPRNTKAYRTIRELKGVVRTHATLFDNPHNPKEWVETMRERYAGTRLGRQEIGGELLEDVLGALWRPKELDDCRVQDHPDLAVVSVAIDPAVSSGPTADDTGIMVGGLGADGNGYLLEDLTCHLPSDGWAQRAVRAYHRHQADRIVAEVNNGGDLVETVIHAIDDSIPVVSVHASRGKKTRAEPVQALYSAKRKRRIHHVGGFAELEDQQTTWVPGEGSSPDRVDALVWLFTDLMLDKQGSWVPL